MTQRQKIDHRINVRHHRPSKGGALVIVLFLVVILSFIMLSISELSGRAIRREFATRAFSENYWRSIGLEPLARRALRDALDYQEGALTKSNPLFGEVFTLPLDNDAIARVAFSDATRCLNVNSFSGERTQNSARNATNEGAKAQLQALGQAFDLSSGDLNAIFAVIADWIDSDDFQEPGGAEDSAYSLLPTPYRTGAREIADISELRAMTGISAELYKNIGYFLCARPGNAPVPINVNHLTLEDAPLLAAVLASGVNVTDAQDIIATIPPGGYTNIDQFWSNERLSGVENASQLRENVGSQFAVTSRYVSARGVIQQGAYSVELNILFRVDGREVHILSRRFGRRG